jgi:hypothetical protein
MDIFLTSTVQVSVALPIANVRAQGFGLEDREPHQHMPFPRYPTLRSRFVRVVSRSHEARLGPHGRTKHISEQAQWACPKIRPVTRVAQDHPRSGMSLWWDGFGDAYKSQPYVQAGCESPFAPACSRQRKTLEAYDPKSGPVPRACPKSGPVPRMGLS